MSIQTIVTTLRNRQNVNTYSDTGRGFKVFTRYQLNKNESFVCWERWESLDRANWVNQNLYLSLKDIVTIIKKSTILS